MEKQFDFGKTIRFLKNNPIIKKKNSIIEKKFDYKDKIDFEKKSILKSIFSTLNFFFFSAFTSTKVPLANSGCQVSSSEWKKKIRFLNFCLFLIVTTQ